MLKALTITLASATCFWASAFAQQNPCDGSAYDDFDFWLGTWDVTDASGTLQGRNAITKEENGCLVIERWTSVNGGTGQSYNYYDPTTEKWRQVWVSGGFTIDYEGGLEEDGTMRLEGEIHLRNGASAPFRGIWTLLADGRIKQHFDQYDTEKEQWNAWFTGYYKKENPIEE